MAERSGRLRVAPDLLGGETRGLGQAAAVAAHGGWSLAHEDRLPVDEESRPVTRLLDELQVVAGHEKGPAGFPLLRQTATALQPEVLVSHRQHLVDQEDIGLD